MNLQLGVITMPYAAEQQSGQKAKKPLKPGRKRTVDRKSEGVPEFVDTFMVATWLEREYKLMRVFYELHEDKIQALAVEAVENRIIDLTLGAPSESTEHLFDELAEQVTTMLKRWISEGGPEQAGIKGVPTQAALAGVNHRLKHPYAKGNPPRMSFIDSGLFEACLKAWVD